MLFKKLLKMTFIAIVAICLCFSVVGCEESSQEDGEKDVLIYEKFEVKFGYTQIYKGFKTREDLIESYGNVRNDENAQSRCVVRVNHNSSLDNSVIAEIFGDVYESGPEIYKEPYNYTHIYENSADVDFDILERIAKIEEVKLIELYIVDEREQPGNQALD